MTDEEYRPFEEVFRREARPLLELLRARLTESGFGPFTEIDVIDHDVARGLGFDATGDDQPDEYAPFVELMLEDGEVHGYEGVGLVLNCSIFGSGQVWAPGNFTDDVGITEPRGVAELLRHFDVAALAQACAEEWGRLSALRSMREAQVPS